MNPPHEPTAELRDRVAALAQFIRQDTIAAFVGIDPKTLRKYYAEELARGEAAALVTAGRTVKQFAGGDFPAGVAPCAKTQLRAAMFLLNTRGGFATKAEVEITAPIEYTGEDADLL